MRVNRLSKKAGKKNKGKIFFGLLIAVSALALILLFLLNASFFLIQDAAISGNDIVSDEDIKSRIGLSDGNDVNIFSFSQKKALSKLFENAYIKTAQIKKNFPNGLEITITERAGKCYVEYENMGMFLLIDETGMVLDVKTYMNEKLPVISGLSFDTFVVGKYLDTDDRDSFSNAILVYRIFEKYGVDLTKLDISDKNNIRIYVGGVDVSFGSTDDADEKVRTLKAILEKLTPGIKGFLDISDVSRDPVFRYLR